MIVATTVRNVSGVCDGKQTKLHNSERMRDIKKTTQGAVRHQQQQKTAGMFEFQFFWGQRSVPSSIGLKRDIATRTNIDIFFCPTYDNSRMILPVFFSLKKGCFLSVRDFWPYVNFLD